LARVTLASACKENPMTQRPEAGPKPRTYTVTDNGAVLAEHIPAEEVCEVMATAGGHASIVDDEDGSILVAHTDGNPATLAALEALLADYETTRMDRLVERMPSAAGPGDAS
jgi:hypothetical protein